MPLEQCVFLACGLIFIPDVGGDIVIYLVDFITENQYLTWKVVLLGGLEYISAC